MYVGSSTPRKRSSPVRETQIWKLITACLVVGLLVALVVAMFYVLGVSALLK